MMDNTCCSNCYFITLYAYHLVFYSASLKKHLYLLYDILLNYFCKNYLLIFNK